MIRKWERIDILLLIVLILAMLSVILTGCRTLTQKERDDFDKEFKHHYNEPQIPEPRP